MKGIAPIGGATNQDGNAMSSLYLEKWLNQTLEEDTLNNFVKTIKKEGKKLPLNSYDLDKMTLMNSGMSP